MKSPTPRDAGNKNPCVQTGVHTAFANPEIPLVDASTIRGAEPERALRACQYLGHAVLRHLDSGLRRAG
jgi:hypothetical protein